MQQASLEDLLGFVERFQRVQSLRASVDLQLTYLNDERTEETTLTDVRGAIVAQRPDAIRVRAQMPVTRSNAFDMTSHDGMFQVYLVVKNRFFEGSTDVETRSEKRSENIRPHHVLEPLLIAPIAERSMLVLDMVREPGAAYYVLLEILPSDGGFRIARKFWFSRADLRLSRLDILNEDGELATSAVYRDWTESGDIVFPGGVAIERPLDGYTLNVTFRDPGINEPPPENAFVLDPPEGIKVERIEEVEDAVTSPNRSS
jgi:hypothetical protein